MTRLLLPLSLILLFSCKGKEKPAPCEGHLIIVHGSKMPDSLHCGDTVEFIVPKKDSLAYWEYAEQGYGGGIASWSQDDSIKSSIDSSSFGPVTYGFKRVHHKKKLTDWSKFVDRYDTIKFAPAGTTIAASPMFEITSWGITHIADSTGTVATRDSSGHWDIKDPARALEVMYKIVWKKDK